MEKIQMSTTKNLDMVFEKEESPKSQKKKPKARKKKKKAANHTSRFLVYIKFSFPTSLH